VGAAKPAGKRGDESRRRVLPSYHSPLAEKTMMDAFWSNYRRAWMIGVNAIIDWQKLVLAQSKWLLSQSRSGGAPPPDTASGGLPAARPAAAAQAAGQQRRWPPPRGSARQDDERVRSRATSRKRV
jgi:hypothetical protein